ncbi:hypothetical protein D3C71_1802740 [compost metagenome]
MTAAAVQGFAEPFLQHAQLARHGGLGQVEHLRGAADIAGIGHAGKGKQLVGSHGNKLSVFLILHIQIKDFSNSTDRSNIS